MVHYTTLLTAFVVYVAAMVTRHHAGAGWRLHLREHRKAKGLSVPRMAEALGIERESVYRLEKRWERVNAQQQIIYAKELQIEPAALWRLPEATLPTARLAEGRITGLSEVDLERIAEQVSRRLSKKR